MIIEGHAIQSRVDMLVIPPPGENILVLDVFGASAEVTSDFVGRIVDGGDGFESR